MSNKKNSLNNELIVINDDNQSEINITSDHVVETLADGTEILKNKEESNNDLEEISNKKLRKLIEFTTGRKDILDDELDRIRDDEDELSKLIKISIHKSKYFTYKPKKNFNKKYRQDRKRKNKQSKKSRINNRK